MRRPVRWLPALFLALVVLLAYLTFAFVDLSPKVDQRFFFAPQSPTYEEAQALKRRFASKELLVVTVYADDISAPPYQRRIAELTNRLVRLERVIGVRSLSNGPADLKEARESPMWRRLLLLEKVQASNLVVVVDDHDPQRLIDSVTHVMREMDGRDFRLRLAGVPYVVDAIGRNLKRDFRTFSLVAVAVFAVVVFALFRSWAILLGSLAACATAAFATFLIQQLLGGRIGLLTANLVTIAFVLTQSHVMYMTNNWRSLRPDCDTPEQAVRRALLRTGSASAWCMLTALLGFASLLYVEAQPLRELGYGGTIATVSALEAAYFVFPSFLLWVRNAGASRESSILRGPSLGFPRPWVSFAILVGALAMGFGTLSLNTDPSLLEYFAKNSEVRRSLEIVDTRGGSSPLDIAVRRADKGRLDTPESYDRMWELQNALQEDPAVGTVLSLPVLMAEAERSPLAFFLSWKWLLDLLSKPAFDRAAESFVSRDRTEAMFTLRMVETDRRERRTEIIARLEKIIRQHGFEPTLVGGIYALQGRLADSVARSLMEGLVGLLLACAVIAIIITRSISAGVVMAACIIVIPAVTLGLAGIAAIPLDIIAAPAVNIAVGVAVDSMIHLGTALRRARQAGLPNEQALREAQRLQAPGIGAFFVVVVSGFTIFGLSSFPPTQRFGVAVVIGTTVAAGMALWVFPGLLAAMDRRS